MERAKWKEPAGSSMNATKTPFGVEYAKMGGISKCNSPSKNDQSVNQSSFYQSSLKFTAPWPRMKRVHRSTSETPMDM